MRYLLLILLVAAGCNTIEYKSASPQIYSEKLNPTWRDYYVGAKVSFWLDSPPH
jgi:hypothetical protein